MSTIVLSFYRFIVLSFYRFIVLSFYRFIVLSFYRFIVLSFYRFIVLSFYRFIVLSFYRFIVTGQKRKTNNQGFGLIEILILSSFGLFVSMSLLKLSEHTTQTTRILRASLAEQDLQYKLTKALSDPADCFYNLKLSHLSDPTNGKGGLSSLVQTNRNNSGDTPNLTDDITLIEPGEFRSALNIVKIELANKTTYNPSSRTLTVYYKKKYGGSQETLDGKPCIAGNGANDQAGCYFKACKVDYRFDPISKKVTTCSLLDCSSRGRGGPGIVGISCAKNQYLRGFDNRGTAICGDLSACPEGKILTGVKNDGSKACGVDLSECADIPVPDTAICKERCKGVAENESNKDCKCIKTTFRGIGPSGERICEKVAQLDQDCPVTEDGQQTVMKGFDEHGKIVCEVPCTGGRKWDGSGCVCEGTDRVWNGLACVCGVGTHWDGLTCVTCPGSKPDYPGNRPDWDGTTCVACPEGSEWDMTLRACRCTGGRDWNTAGTCECPATAPWWNAGICKPCPSSTPKFNSVNNICEACPTGTPWWDVGECKACPATTPWWNAGICKACPGDKPWYDDGGCKPCPATTPWWNAGVCETCPYPSAPKWNNITKQCETCPGDLVWSITNRRCECPHAIQIQVDDTCHCPAGTLVDHQKGCRCYNQSTKHGSNSGIRRLLEANWNANNNRCECRPPNQIFSGTGLEYTDRVGCQCPAGYYPFFSILPYYDCVRY